MKKKKKVFGLFLITLTLLLIGGYLAINKTPEQTIPVLMYHHLSEKEEDWSSATISPQKFKEDMLYLKALGFETILPDDLIQFQQNGTPLPEQPILITFDDGYRSNYTYAYPILKELNMKAVINVIVSTVGRDTSLEGTPITPHFSWEEAQEMMESGLIDIQHHTYDLHQPGDGKYGKGVAPLHNESPSAYEARLLKDLQRGETELVNHLGKKPVLFAYPYGVFTEESEKILKSQGYAITLSVKDGATALSDDLFLLQRINMPHDKESPALMKTILKHTGLTKPIPFEEIKDAKKRIEQLQEKEVGLP